MAKTGAYLRWGLSITGIIILVVVSFRFKQYILPVLAVIGGVLGFLFGTGKKTDPIPDEVEKLEEEAAAINNGVLQRKEDTDRRVEESRKETERLDKAVQNLKSGGPIMILLAFISLIAGTAWAANNDIYIPKDYEELKTRYIAAIKLLDELDADIKSKQKLIDDLQKERDDEITAYQKLERANRELTKIVDDQSAKLDRLNRQWGLTPGYQTSQGATLGITRRFDFFSVGLGATSQGSLFGNCTIWF